MTLVEAPRNNSGPSPAQAQRARDYAETLIRTADVLVIGLDEDGAVSLANHTLQEVSGYTEAELLGRNWFDVALPRDRYPQVWADYSRRHECFLDEYVAPLLTRDGEERLIAWRNTAVRDEAGDMLETVSFGIDITERERAAERLRKSEELNRTLLAAIPQRVFYKDTDGRFLLVNPAFAADFGRRPEDFAGKTDADFFPVELAEKFRADDLRVMQTRETETIIEKNLLREGWRFLEVTKAPVVGGDGEVLGVLGLFTDVTGRVEMQDELARERELLHCLMDNARDLIYFKDRDSRFTRINQVCARHMGLASPEEAVGRSDFDFYPRPVATEYFDDEQAILESGAPLLNKVERGTGPDGEARHILSTKVPILKDGEAVGLLGISRDVTARVHAEEELQRTAAELARSNEELQQFAYVASHDLQEPLRMVASYTQLLARRYQDRLDEDAHEFIRYAVDGATRMQGLIHDLLTYSRVGTRDLEHRPLDLNAALDRAVANLRAAIEETAVEITRDALPTLPLDGVQIAQLLQNLIGNGLKFRGEAPPRIHVSAAYREDRSDWLFGVHDNGIGIEPEYAERIFAIFQRLHTREQYAGTGIGLSICRKIVGRHGGQIWCQPGAEGGSVFYFSLPTDPTGATSANPELLSEPQN